MAPLHTMTRSSLSPEALVEGSGRVIARYDHRTQDSGNISWIVSTADGDFFVKSAGEGAPPPEGAAVPYFDHSGRVRLLRTAVGLARSAEHPALARLRTVVETPYGPVLVYDRAPGDLVGVPAPGRQDPESPYRRFAAAAPQVRAAIFDQLLDAHRVLDAAGWVAGDLYDGCLMVDLDTSRLTLIDLDTYRRGACANDMGRMFGSSRFMAPEEHVLGATLDARTTVFTLGRILRHFGTGLTEDLGNFCAGTAAAGVVERATRPARDERFASVVELEAAWRTARGADHPGPAPASEARM